jgi:hypothetical protein
VAAGAPPRRLAWTLGEVVRSRQPAALSGEVGNEASQRAEGEQKLSAHDISADGVE